MSVRSGDRSLGKITAIDATRILISYTYDRVHDKTLPKSDRWLMAKTIWDDASILDSLCASIDTLHIKERISDDRAEYWTELATTAQNLVKGMLKANRRDYKTFLE